METVSLSTLLFTGNATEASTSLFNTTAGPTNATVLPDASKPYPEYVGYIAALVAVIMYGSNFVPIKKFYTGDGMFFQWVLCCGIFIVGVIIQVFRQSPFYPLAMVGGLIWTTGNLCVVPIFKTIGMGLGMSTWSTFGLIIGWASGRFGFFGTIPDEITNSGMNYAGVALAFGSIMLYVMVKNEVSGTTSDMEIIVNVDETQPLISTEDESAHRYYDRTPYMNGYATTMNGSANGFNGSAINGSAINGSAVSINGSAVSINGSAVSINGSVNAEYSKPLLPKPGALADDRIFIEDLSPLKKRIIGTGLSVLSGVLYGFQFTPCVYIQDNYPGASENGLDYVFAQFCGIYVASCLYFFIYCAVTKNKPKIYPETILPGIVSGMMWAVATACWFIANAEISEAVSYPIISTAPSAIASLFWGVFIFHEIQGKRNILILLAAFGVMSAGAILAGLSK